MRSIRGRHDKFPNFETKHVSKNRRTRRHTYQMVARSHATPTTLFVWSRCQDVDTWLVFWFIMAQIRSHCLPKSRAFYAYKQHQVKDPAEPNHARRECTKSATFETIREGVNPWHFGYFVWPRPDVPSVTSSDTSSTTRTNEKWEWGDRKFLKYDRPTIRSSQPFWTRSIQRFQSKNNL